MAQKNLTLRQQCGLAIVAVTGPGMALLNWATPTLHSVPQAVLLSVAAVGGGTGMALMSPRPLRTIGIVCGFLIGLGSFTLHSYYSTFRSEMWNYESALVGVLGALPGILLYLGVRKWKIQRLSADSLANGNAPNPDLTALHADSLFVRNPVSRDVVMSELNKLLLIIASVIVGVMLSAFLLLLIFSLSEFSAAKTVPKCTVVSYAQFMKGHARTGWYRIKDCLIDLREAVYTVDPPEGRNPHGHIASAYIPIHGGAGSKETNTQLVISPYGSAGSTLYSQLQEIEALREAHPNDAVEVLNTHPEQFVSRRDIQGTLASGDTVYPTSLLQSLSSCQPPLSHDFVVVNDGDNPSSSSSLHNITLSAVLCAFTLPLFVFLLRRLRKAK
jgi:hypothetical protein